MRLFLALLFLIPSLAAANPNDEANALFVEAVQLWRQAEAIEADDHVSLATQYTLLGKAADNLNRIIEDHPQSDLAVQLIIGPVGPVSIVALAEQIEVISNQIEMEKVNVAQINAAQAHCAVDFRECVIMYAIATASSEPRNVPLWLEIAKMYLAIGQFEEAKKIAQEHTYLRDLTLTRTTTAQAASGAYEAAHETAAMIEDPCDQAEAYIAIAAAYANADDQPSASALISSPVPGLAKCNDSSQKAEVLAEKSMVQLAIGETKESLLSALAAKTIALRLSASDRQDIAFYSIAEAFLKLDSPDHAFELITKIDGDYYRSRALQELALLHVKRGEPDQAMRTLGFIDISRRTWRQREIAIALAKAGRFDQALWMAESIEVEFQRTLALSGIAQEQAKAGASAAADETLQEAVDIAFSIPDAESRAWAFLSIARSKSYLGDIEGAWQTIETATKAIAEVADPKDKAGLLLGLANWHHVHSGVQAAWEAIENATLVIAEVADPEEKAELLVELADMHHVLGDTDGAKHLISEAIKAARSIADPFLRSFEISRIAETLVRFGDSFGALDLANSIEDPSYRVVAYLFIIQALSEE